MKPVLVIALGNELAGDDGIAPQLLRRLRSRSGMSDVEFLEGGSDLLRLEPALLEHERILLIDAFLDEGPPGRMLRFDDLQSLDQSGGAHTLSPAHALELLRAIHPDLRTSRVTLLGVTIDRVTIGPGLSAPLLACLDDVMDAVHREILSILAECRPGIAAAGPV